MRARFITFSLGPPTLFGLQSWARKMVWRSTIAGVLVNRAAWWRRLNGRWWKMEKIAETSGAWVRASWLNGDLRVAASHVAMFLFGHSTGAGCLMACRTCCVGEHGYGAGGSGYARCCCLVARQVYFWIRIFGDGLSRWSARHLAAFQFSFYHFSVKVLQGKRTWEERRHIPK